MVNRLQHLQELINPLAIATRGRISTSIKKALTYATLGLLVISAEVTPPKIIGSGSSATHVKRYPDAEKNILYNRLVREDDEMLTFLKIFLQCQK